MIRAFVIVAALGAAPFVACGSDDASPPASSSSTPFPEQAATPPPSDTPEASSDVAPYVGSLTVDPGDATLLIGTGLGLFRLKSGESKAIPAKGTLDTDVGSGSISPNLVLRFSAPSTLIASGHPAGEGTLPEELGVIRSDDGGGTWRPLSLLGEADLHALDVRGDRVIGHPIEEERLIVSSDGGKTFQDRTPPGMPIDVDIDPGDPDRVALTTTDGFFVSRDAGSTWRQRDALSVETFLAWSETGPLYRVEAGGVVRASEDDGETWEERGNVGGSPSTVAAGPDGALYVAIAGAEILRSDDRGRTFTRVTQIRV